MNTTLQITRVTPTTIWYIFGTPHKISISAGHRRIILRYIIVLHDETSRRTIEAEIFNRADARRDSAVFAKAELNKMMKSIHSRFFYIRINFKINKGTKIRKRDSGIGREPGLDMSANIGLGNFLPFDKRATYIRGLWSAVRARLSQYIARRLLLSQNSPQGETRVPPGEMISD